MPFDLDPKQIAHHLELALEGDEANLRQKVELLHTHLNRKPRKQPCQARHSVTWDQQSRTQWHVKCHHNDAKNVDEMFADFMERKSPRIDGKWLRKPSPVLRIGPWRVFEFNLIEAPKKKGIPKDKKKEKEQKPLSLDMAIANISEEQAAKLLQALLAKRGQ